MLSSLHRAVSRRIRSSARFSRCLVTAAPESRDRTRKEGDISAAFASLSGLEATPLPQRYADIKTALIQGHERDVEASWKRLLSSLRTEVENIASTGSDIIPSIDYTQITNSSKTQPFEDALRKHGVAIIRNVVSEDVAVGWKEEIKDYIRQNPHTTAFPQDKPAVYELYWSPGQIKARAHPNMLETQSFLMSHWHSKDPSAAVSTNDPIAYADRLRIRQPGDAAFALGPHIDGGSVERWEPQGYGLGGTYDSVFAGQWEALDPWESSTRLAVESDLYTGLGACSAFRMFQGWLSMSRSGPLEGTLLVNPLFKLATAYMLLRPFFSPKTTSVEASGYLDESNWQLDPIQSSALQGATPGCGQELSDALHPHLDLSRTMIHIPVVNPGDYVAWHCDSIHAVDKTHAGKSDSSVLYIPACPLTKLNAEYLVRQREAFLSGVPSPDFPGGKGESGNVGRMTTVDIEKAGGLAAKRAMGLAAWGGEAPFVKEMNQSAGLSV